ncbi:transposable element Tcb2 transposase [Trichonephila clavipes]|uniref:Transposable element Tcb2 transposase n=1 Tax=Trichonephila clavipes TaxID=2585209 RepID=A0A8X7BNK8_TRICX|nr:transposable element Tcb2 transposase [Trichonephila clavipes]
MSSCRTLRGGRIIGMMEAGWSARRVARQLGHSDSVPTTPSAAIQALVAPSLGAPVSSQNIRRCLAEGHLGSRRPLRVLPLTPTHRRHRLEWCHGRGHWTGAEWNQVVFSDESRFNLSSDDNRTRVWRPRSERLNPAFALQRHTAPTAGVMVWGTIAYNTWSPIVLIRGTMTAQRYVHDMQPHVLPLVQWLPGTIFQQDNARPHTERVSQDCLRTVTTHSWPVRSPDLSPIEHFWDHLGWRVGHPTSLNERSKVTANMERNISRHHTELVYLNARSYRIVHSRYKGFNRVLNPPFFAFFLK